MNSWPYHPLFFSMVCVFWKRWSWIRCFPVIRPNVKRYVGNTLQCKAQTGKFEHFRLAAWHCRAHDLRGCPLGQWIFSRRSICFNCKPTVDALSSALFFEWKAGACKVNASNSDCVWFGIGVWILCLSLTGLFWFINVGVLYSCLPNIVT